jgi:hypothetical protein
MNPFTVLIKKPNGTIIDQHLDTVDQVKRFKKLAIDNGYEIIKGSVRSRP